MGIWAPQHGVVRLDGADIANWDKNELGPHVGYLPQDIELFEGSISENIARFSDIDPDKVIRAARVAGVHEMILCYLKVTTPLLVATGLTSPVVNASESDWLVPFTAHRA